MVSATPLARAYSPYATFEELGSNGAVTALTPFLGDAAIEELLRQRRRELTLAYISTAVTAILATATVWSLLKNRKKKAP